MEFHCMKIQNFQIFNLRKEQLSVQEMRRFLQVSTLVGSFGVCVDYDAGGSKPYMGRGEEWGNPATGKQWNHLVVIVGEYQDDSVFEEGEPIEPLWIYQNSDGNHAESMLGNGLSVLRHGVLNLVAYAGILPNSVQLKRSVAREVKPSLTKPRVQPEILLQTRRRRRRR